MSGSPRIRDVILSALVGLRVLEGLWSVVGGAFFAVQGPCGKRALGVFHRSGTIHGLFRRSATAQDGPGATIVTTDDPQHGVIHGPYAIPEDRLVVLVDNVESLQ